MDVNIKYLKKYLSEDLLDKGIKDLEKGIPVQYIVGNVDFMGYVINVDSRVLIPRFETELLVDKTINFIRKKFGSIKNLNILDIGTGSGCISIVLKKELDCSVTAVDISKDALDVARNNAIMNNVDINFLCSDVFSNVNGKFDIIISNPPYISYNEEIEEIVKNNEPHSALYASNNGLYFYEKILKECSDFLKNEYLVCFEIGYLQAFEIKKLVYKYLGDVLVYVEKDYSGKDRFVFIENK